MLPRVACGPGVLHLCPFMHRPLSSYLARYRMHAAAGALCVLAYLGGSLYAPAILARIIDGLKDRSAGEADILRLIALFFVVATATSLVAIGMRRLLLGLANRVEYDIRRDAFARLTELDQAYFQRERTGDLMTRMSSDLAAVRELVGQGMLQGTRIVVGFPLAFGVMFVANVHMTLLVLSLLPVVSILFFFFIRRIRVLYERSQEQFSEITNFAQESFGGIRTIKGFGIEERQRGRFSELNEDFIGRNMALTRTEAPLWPFMMLMYVVGAALLLLVGGRLVVNGEVSLGGYVKFQQYLIFLQWPMLSLGWTANILQRGRMSWKRLCTILGGEAAVRDPAAPVAPGAESFIAFRDVSLIRDGRRLLDRVSLSIPAGQFVAITGPTGAGKTLLVSLLPRLLDPDEGEVRLGGRDVRTLSLAALRGLIGMAPQEPFLFSDTLAANLSMGLDAAEDPMTQHGERVAWAARVAGLSDDVERFPEQYRTLLGERGVTLSGGQRQRTAIGRALARKPSIVILDDVLSAVDTQTEARILERLRPELAGRTTLLISHRVSTLRHADRIVVIEDGRIAQDGSHAELAAQPGYYRELDEVQRLEARLETT